MGHLAKNCPHNGAFNFFLEKCPKKRKKRLLGMGSDIWLKSANPKIIKIIPERIRWTIVGFQKVCR
jgi:hypothetical protein